MEHTRQLASFASRCQWGDLPANVQHEAVRAFVNWVGCAYGGANHPATASAVAALRELSAAQPCSVLGRAERFAPLDAALLNGLSASAYAYDDTHLSTIGHPTAPTVAALIAHVQSCGEPVSGEQFLLSLIVSNEVQTRLACAMAVPPAKCHVGLYMTGHTGAAGVAAGVGRLMALDDRHMNWAIGTGATQGGGFRASHASSCSGLIPANAGRGGLLAARLAAQGFTCNEAALETTNGFLDTLSSPPNADALTRDLGTHWECLNVAAKPFPAGCFIHPTIDACLQVAKRQDFRAEEVDRVELRVHALALGLTGKPEPKTAYDAQVSVYHWAAAVLQQGRAGLEEASEACVTDPAVVKMRQRVVAAIEPSIEADAALVTVVLRDGRRLEAGGTSCLGSASNPMTDSQIEDKFVAQAAVIFGADRARELVSRCWDIASVQDVARVMSDL